MVSLKELLSHPSSPVRRAAAAALSFFEENMPIAGLDLATVSSTPVAELLHQLSTQPEAPADALQLLHKVLDTASAANAALPLELMGANADPMLMDVPITDVKEDDLQGMAASFEVGYLSQASAAPSFPVQGFLYGVNYRPMVNLVVEVRGRPPVNVLFLVDTASAPTFLSTSTLTALGFREHTPRAVQATVHGCRMTAYHGPHGSNLADLNLLGALFFVASRAQLHIDYGVEQGVCISLKP